MVRLPNGGAVLTRVAPGRRETSMLLRARPGWAALRAYLEGQDNQRRCARRRARTRGGHLGKVRLRVTVMLVAAQLAR